MELGTGEIRLTWDAAVQVLTAALATGAVVANLRSIRKGLDAVGAVLIGHDDRLKKLETGAARQDEAIATLKRTASRIAE